MSIVDLRRSPPQAPIETDVCVIGAGAAGLTVASELGRAGRDVVLLESGGFAPDEKTQALNDLVVAGHPLRENFVTRARYYGGSCNLWDGRSMWLTPEDLAPESDPEREGWPISYAELTGWYRAAARVLRLPDVGTFEAGARVAGLSRPERALFDSGLVTPTLSLWARTPMRFGSAHRAELRRSERVRVMLYGNALRLRRDEAGRRAAALEAAVLLGPTFEVRARSFVLAGGGVENPRLLLVSDLGNEHDLVGRYYMDHPRAAFGLVRLAPGVRLPSFRGRPLPDGRLQLGIAIPPATRRAEGLLNHYASLESEASGYAAAAARSSAPTAQSVRPAGYRGGRWKDLVPHPFSRLYWSARSALHPRPDGRAKVLVYFCEQPPHRDSRVLLGSARDALGQPKVELRWRIGPEVSRSLLALQDRVATAFRAVGVGAVDAGEGEPRYTDASHHMGTTRMSREPRNGVVDRDCRVHSVDNLYLAGSSVFPTAGHANPTPTIVALALRLAAHLSAE